MWDDRKSSGRCPGVRLGRVSGHTAATQHRGHREKKRVCNEVRRGHSERCYSIETPLPRHHLSPNSNSTRNFLEYTDSGPNSKLPFSFHKSIFLSQCTGSVFPDPAHIDLPRALCLYHELVYPSFQGSVLLWTTSSSYLGSPHMQRCSLGGPREDYRASQGLQTSGSEKLREACLRRHPRTPFLHWEPLRLPPH